VRWKCGLKLLEFAEHLDPIYDLRQIVTFQGRDGLNELDEIRRMVVKLRK
jgi:hypothetical protein